MLKQRLGKARSALSRIRQELSELREAGSRAKQEADEAHLKYLEKAEELRTLKARLKRLSEEESAKLVEQLAEKLSQKRKEALDRLSRGGRLSLSELKLLTGKDIERLLES